MDTKIKLSWPMVVLVLGLAAAAVVAGYFGLGELAGALGGFAGGVAVPSRARVGA